MVKKKKDTTRKETREHELHFAGYDFTSGPKGTTIHRDLVSDLHAGIQVADPEAIRKTTARLKSVNKPYAESEAEFTALCRKAAVEAGRSFNATGCAAHYLYYKPQGMELVMAMEQPEGFELGDPQAQRGSLTEDQLTHWITERARRLPILKPE